MTDNDKPLREMSDDDLQNANLWDWDSAEQLPAVTPRRRARAVVSVAFPGEQFDFVSDAAELADMKLSHFIREAAFEKAAGITANLGVGTVTNGVKSFESGLPLVDAFGLDRVAVG